VVVPNGEEGVVWIALLDLSCRFRSILDFCEPQVAALWVERREVRKK
jgi:hypothetical protein